MSNDVHTPEEFERAIKAFYFVTYGKSYHLQRTRTLKGALKRLFRKDPALKLRVSPSSGTPNAFRFQVVNLHRYWQASGNSKLPHEHLYASLPVPDIDHATRKPNLAHPPSQKSTVSRDAYRRMHIVGVSKDGIEIFDNVSQHSSPADRQVFYKSWEWRTLRMMAFKRFGRRCMCCGATPADKAVSGADVRLVVDHIKPLSYFWHMRLVATNLQILCDECNQGKGAWDETDHRSDAERAIAQQIAGGI